jgi:citrate lyase subunit beta/citryl-CoA lyase
MIAKAAAGQADALIVDLEDAVPLPRKDAARVATSNWLDQRQAERDVTSSGGSQQKWVRISAASIEEDLGASVRPGLSGIFLAKSSLATLTAAAECLSELESDRHLPPGSVGIIGLIEGAEALQQLEYMARLERVLTFAVGEVDLMADLRMKRGHRSEPALDAIRSRVVICSAAAGLLPPVAPTSTAIRELDAFMESSHKMHDLGFRSRTAVHPSQLPVIHDVFTPGEDVIAAARDIVIRYQKSGGSVALDKDGRMIDAAIVRGALETLNRSEVTF